MFDDGFDDYTHNASRRDALNKLTELLREYAAASRDGFTMPILAISVTADGKLKAYRRWPRISPEWRDYDVNRLHYREVVTLVDALRKELGHVPRHGA